MSAAPSGTTHTIRKTIAFGSLRRRFACRTHPIESAVTPSLVAETRTLGYQVYSLFTISNIAHGAKPLAKLCDTGLNARPDPSGPGGARRYRTDDLMLAKHALSQLSYGPLAEGQGFM